MGCEGFCFVCGGMGETGKGNGWRGGTGSGRGIDKEGFLELSLMRGELWNSGAEMLYRYLLATNLPLALLAYRDIE